MSLRDQICFSSVHVLFKEPILGFPSCRFLYLQVTTTDDQQGSLLTSLLIQWLKLIFRRGLRQSPVVSGMACCAVTVIVINVGSWPVQD